MEREGKMSTRLSLQIPLRTILFFVCLFVFILGTLASVSASKILSTNTDENTISLIDTITNTKQTLNVSDGPSKLILTPDRTKAITTLRRGNGIAIIDLTNWRVEGIVKTGRKPADLLLLNNKIYVANSYGGNVAVVDFATRTVTKTIEVKAGPSSLALLQQRTLGETGEATTQRVAVLNRNSGMISLIDPVNDTVVEEIDIGSLTKDPVLLAITQDGSKAFIADARKEELLHLDPTANFSLVNIYPINEISEYNQIYLGNKYLIISNNIRGKGEIQIINTDDKSSFSISLDKKTKGIDFSSGVIYVASNDVVTMINRETSIEKDFAAGKGVTSVVVLQEDYVPLGDTEVTEGETPKSTTAAGESSEPSFPWTRILILIGILVAIILFLRSKHDDEGEEKGSEEKKEGATTENAQITSTAPAASTPAEEKKTVAEVTYAKASDIPAHKKIPLTPRSVVPKATATAAASSAPPAAGTKETSTEGSSSSKNTKVKKKSPKKAPAKKSKASA